jgi:hypothetical protein
MPNQRAKNKVLLGAFVDCNLKSSFLEIARSQGVTASDALIAAIHDYISRSTHVSAAIESASEPSVSSNVRPASQPANTLASDEVWLL